MKYQTEDRTILMGEFHNAVVDLVDSCELMPPEISMVLRMITTNIEKLFETAVKASKIEEKPNGSNV